MGSSQAALFFTLILERGTCGTSKFNSSNSDDSCLATAATYAIDVCDGKKLERQTQTCIEDYLKCFTDLHINEELKHSKIVKIRQISSAYHKYFWKYGG